MFWVYDPPSFDRHWGMKRNTTCVDFIVTHYHNTFAFQKVKESELGDAVLVDADKNTVSTEYDDLNDLPDEIVSVPAPSVLCTTAQVSLGFDAWTDTDEAQNVQSMMIRMIGCRNKTCKAVLG